jgi:hypothetical protein
VQFVNRHPDVSGESTLSNFIKGLRDEIVKTHYDPTRVSANIIPVRSRVPVGWSFRIDISRRKVGTTEKLIKTKNNKLNAK